MSKKEDFTMIKNDVLEALISSGLSGIEMSMALFIYRKTFGWGKKSDLIATSQFIKAIPATRRSIENAKKNLKLVKIIALVKKGAQDGTPSEWSFNDNPSSWQLVQKTALVQKITKPSAKKGNRLVQKTAHTKETITKETITKETPLVPQGGEVLSFEESILCLFERKAQVKLRAREKYLTQIKARAKTFNFEDLAAAIDKFTKDQFMINNGFSKDPSKLFRNDGQIEKWMNRQEDTSGGMAII